MDLLADRKNDDQPIFRAHVERTLKDHSRKMKDAQNKGMSGFTSDIWRQHHYVTDDHSLSLTHRIEHRFVDMKTRTVQGAKKKKKHHEVHNRIIMGHYNGIMKDLIYGAGEDVAQEMRRTFQDKEI